MNIFNRKEKKVKLFWEELKNGGPLKKMGIILFDIVMGGAVWETLLDIQKNRTDAGDYIMLIICSIYFIGMTYGTIQYLKRPYRCLPVSRWLNVSELKKSLEKETFQKIEPTDMGV